MLSLLHCISHHRLSLFHFNEKWQSGGMNEKENFSRYNVIIETWNMLKTELTENSFTIQCSSFLYWNLSSWDYFLLSIFTNGLLGAISTEPVNKESIDYLHKSEVDTLVECEIECQYIRWRGKWITSGKTWIYRSLFIKLKIDNNSQERKFVFFFSYSILIYNLCVLSSL